MYIDKVDRLREKFDIYGLIGRLLHLASRYFVGGVSKTCIGRGHPAL